VTRLKGLVSPLESSKGEREGGVAHSEVRGGEVLERIDLIVETTGKMFLQKV